MVIRLGERGAETWEVLASLLGDRKMVESGGPEEGWGMGGDPRDGFGVGKRKKGVGVRIRW